MVAKSGGVKIHPKEELQFPSRFANGGVERGPHTVVAGIEDQYRTLILARRLRCGDQCGQTRKSAPGSSPSENGA